MTSSFNMKIEDIEKLEGNTKLTVSSQYGKLCLEIPDSWHSNLEQHISFDMGDNISHKHIMSGVVYNVDDTNNYISCGGLVQKIPINMQKLMIGQRVVLGID